MSSRIDRIKLDYRTVVDATQADANCPFVDFELNDMTMMFRYNSINTMKTFTLNMSSNDYPEYTVVTVSDRPEHTEVIGARIPLIFNRISREYYKDMNIALPYFDDDDIMEVDYKPPSVERMISKESVASHYTDCTDMSSEHSDENEDYDDYYNENGDMNYGEEVQNPLLLDDIDRVKLLYGSKSINERMFGTIDDIDVELMVDMTFLDEEIAKAWKVVRDEPLVIRLHLSLSRYLDATEPKVEVFQHSMKDKEKSGVAVQVKKIMELFVMSQWKNISNETMSTKKTKPVVKPPPPSKSKKAKFESFLSEPGNMGGIDSPAGLYQPQEQSINSIVEMGFARDVTRNALVIARGNIDEALNLLVTSPESVNDSMQEENLVPASSAQGAKPKNSAPTPPPRPSRKQSKHKPKSSKAANDSSGQSDELHLKPSTTAVGKCAKRIPQMEEGFLVQVMRYAYQRVPTLNEYCVVCDEPHVFQNGAMLKPAVCARELCVFAFQTLGVMSDAAEDIATGAEVVDLLIAMCNAACRHNRREKIFDPFPTIVDPSNPTELALHPKNKDYKTVEKILECFMSMREMTSKGANLKRELDAGHKLAYPLLQWIISSNRSHIVKLPEERQVKFMLTPHQFLLLSSPPAKEGIFRAAKAKHGSTFAFHGSNIENWHAIMRIGLINASGTKHQLHGAAYGNGIYLSPHASVSFGYSGIGVGSYHRSQKGRSDAQSKKGVRFLSSKHLTCIALCEVVTTKELKKHGNIWVSPNPDHVCTRFFFVYEDGQVGGNNIDTQNEAHRKEILKALSFQTLTMHEPM
ncbi:unnamed protein product [Owenia fusiformis]|uniref:Uncharacterized protein n=1 Tax=Owenia fusiformis TaxID=6347 RepID=A0A8J1XTG1_OWEFU|nr:unnamed protein product [Owenia fusiformis]